MTDMTPGIVITGASGRMGRMLIQTVIESDRAHLHAALERPGHPWVGQDVGLAMGGAALDVTVTDDPLDLSSQTGTRNSADATAPTSRTIWFSRYPRTVPAPPTVN